MVIGLKLLGQISQTSASEKIVAKRDGVWVNVFLANIRMPLLNNLKHLWTKKYKLSRGLVASANYLNFC